MSTFIRRHRTACWTFVGVTVVLILTIGFAEERMSASEMRSLLSGSTASGRTNRGSEYYVYHRPDGVMSGYAHSEHYDVGTWEITEDDKFCRQWTSWRYGSRDCFDMYQIGEGQFRMISNAPHFESTFIVRNGDPEELKGRIGYVGFAAPETL